MTATQPKVLSVMDESGNTLFATQNNNCIIIELKLVKESYRRKLGIVNIEEKIFQVTRKREKHLHWKSNSYGFNHRVLNTATKFNKVQLSDEKHTWIIPVEYILKYGHYLHFSQVGFELQIFIKLEHIEQFKQP